MSVKTKLKINSPSQYITATTRLLQNIEPTKTAFFRRQKDKRASIRECSWSIDPGEALARSLRDHPRSPLGERKSQAIESRRSSVVSCPVRRQTAQWVSLVKLNRARRQQFDEAVLFLRRKCHGLFQDFFECSISHCDHSSLSFRLPGNIAPVMTVVHQQHESPSMNSER